MCFCPTCGYTEIKITPRNFKYCPCCLTTFEYDIDMLVEDNDYELLRNQWIQNGMLWAQGRQYHGQIPENWNPIKQLLNIGVIYECE